MVAQSSLGVNGFVAFEHADELLDLAHPRFRLFSSLYPKQDGVAVPRVQRRKERAGAEKAKGCRAPFLARRSQTPADVPPLRANQLSHSFWSRNVRRGSVMAIPMLVFALRGFWPLETSKIAG